MNPIKGELPMSLIKGLKTSITVFILIFFTLPAISLASNDNKINAVIANQIFEKAKENSNWKLAYVTGKDAQVVFMNITPQTNPNNEIGMETHPFDQVIFVVEGKAKAILDGKESIVKANDMIYVPQGTPHNFINLNGNKPFKIISIYSDTDIPVNAVYKKKSDEQT